MAHFRTHEEGIENVLDAVETKRGEGWTHLQLLVGARQLAAEVRCLHAARCEGCVTATDVGMPEYEPRVVHAHPKCLVHAQLAEAQAELAQLRAMKQRAQAIAAGCTFLAEVDMRAVAREILGEVS